MRSLLIAALLLTAIVPLPGASAKALLEDAQGDTQLEALPGASVPLSGGSGESADLLALEVLEDAEELTFLLSVANLNQQVSFNDYAIQFTWKGDAFGVIVSRTVMHAVLDDNWRAYLVTEDDDRWDAFAQLEHHVDLEKGVIMVHLPKPYILSESGRYPALGDKLEDLYVEAESQLAFMSFTLNYHDRMPDEGEAEYAFLFGDLASGRLRLDADERVRVSNGGATTFVYEVTVQNKAESDDEVSLALHDMPEGWNGTVQSPVRVPGGSERRVAILVSVPFAHDHGGFSSFNLTATSQRDPAALAAIRMGVLHTPIPQPAGHHAELYLHGESYNAGIFGQIFPWTSGYVNTDGNHDGDVAEVSPWGGGDGFDWHLPLQPGLRMGLDFDLDRTGEIVGSIVGRTVSEGTIRAELSLMTPDGEDGFLLAESDKQPLALDLSAPSAFKLTLTPTEESDYVPYQKGQNLMLMLYYETDEEGIGTICCLPGATPGLVVQDFKMSLPLNEYHDKLSGLAEAAADLELKAEGPVEKAGYPGATMTYQFTLVNHDVDEHVIDLDLAGTDATLGTLVPSGSVRLGPKESKLVTLAVAIPSDKNDGEELEVLLFAHARDDPSTSAIARTKTLVAKTGAEDAAADESDLLLAAQQAENNDTPAPGGALLLAALAAVALAARRR